MISKAQMSAALQAYAATLAVNRRLPTEALDLLMSDARSIAASKIGVDPTRSCAAIRVIADGYKAAIQALSIPFAGHALAQAALIAAMAQACEIMTNRSRHTTGVSA